MEARLKERIGRFELELRVYQGDDGEFGLGYLQLSYDAVIPRKAALKPAQHVLLQDGRAVANDLDTAVILEVPGLGGGRCLVPHKPVLEALKRIPGLEFLDIRVEGKKLLMAWKGGRSVFETEEVEKFPPLPRVEGEAVRVDGDRLVRAMAAVAPCCAKDDSRPVLKGVILSPSGEGTEVLASDGFRMAIASLPFAVGQAVVPAKAVEVLEHLWRRIPPAPAPAEDLVQAVLNPRELELTLGGSVVAFRFGRAELVAKLIPGTPPDHRRLIPGDPGQKVLLLARNLEVAVQRLKGVSEIIQRRWENGVLRVTAEDGGKEAEAELQVQAEGSGRIALSAKYLLDYLKGKDGLVTMEVQGGALPVVLRSSGAPLTVIMPMRAQK